MTIHEILSNDIDFQRRLLGRMLSDCEYCVNTGETHHLWGVDKRCHIEYMFTIHLNVSIDLGVLERINMFAEKMGVSVWTKREFIGRWVKNGVVFEIFRLWGDGKGDRMECYTYKVGHIKSTKIFAKAKDWVGHMDFLLYCQYNYKY